MEAKELIQFARLARKIAGELNGHQRAKKLTKQRRVEIARKASRARWGKKEKAIA